MNRPFARLHGSNKFDFNMSNMHSRCQSEEEPDAFPKRVLVLVVPGTSDNRVWVDIPTECLTSSTPVRQESEEQQSPTSDAQQIAAVS